MEYGVYGDLIIIYPKPDSIYLRGTSGLSLGFRVEGLGLNNGKKALCDADLGTVRLSSGGPGIFVFPQLPADSFGFCCEGTLRP